MHGFSRRLSERFQALDRTLHIDHRGRSEWIWAVPIFTLLATFGLFLAAGLLTPGISPALYVPIGVFVAVIMAGMSIAYMTPEADSPGDGGGDGGEPVPAPTTPPRPGWLRALRDSNLPDEPAAPRREREKAAR